jgi:hypothetical protein
MGYLIRFLPWAGWIVMFFVSFAIAIWYPTLQFINIVIGGGFFAWYYFRGSDEIRKTHLEWCLRASQTGAIVFPDPTDRVDLAQNLADLNAPGDCNEFGRLCEKYDVHPDDGGSKED